MALLVLANAGLAQNDSQIVWLSDVNDEVLEGGSIFFNVNREGGTDTALDVTVNFAPETPIEGFNSFHSDDAEDADGAQEADVTVRIPAGRSGAEGRLVTRDNWIVNADVDVELTVTATAGVLLSNDARFPHTKKLQIKNDGDTYVTGVRRVRQISSFFENQDIQVVFMRCVGTTGQSGYHNCDDAEFGVRAGALSPPALTRKIFVETTGNYFASERLFDTMQEEVTTENGTEMQTVDAAVFGAGDFTKTYIVDLVDDDADEPNGQLSVATAENPAQLFEGFLVYLLDNDLPEIYIEAVDAEVTEGNQVHFTITRISEAPLPEITVPVAVAYPDKILGGDTPVAPTSRSLTISAGQTSSPLFAARTYDEEVNDGDAMVRATLQVKPADFNITTQVAWVRVVDDDIPEISLSLDSTAIVEGDLATWTLTRSCCSGDALGVNVETEITHYFPDEFWEDRVSSISNSQLSDSFYVGHIDAGDLSTSFKDNGNGGATANRNIVGPQGGKVRRRLQPFPDQEFEGVPLFSNRTFNPRYTVNSSDWLEFTIANNAPEIDVESAESSVDEGERISFTVTRSGGAASLIEKWGTRVRVSVEQTGSFVADSEIGTRTVWIAPGLTAATLNLDTADDQADTADGSVTVTVLEGAAGDQTEDAYDFDDRFSELAQRYIYKSTVNILDNDEVGATVTPTALTVDEDDSATYTVALDLVPTGSVTVTPSRTSGSDTVTVSGPLTFTTSNWSAAQTVTVSAAEDIDTEDETAEIGHGFSGGGYGGVTADTVTVNVPDNDTPRVTLALSHSSIGENAGVATVTATLNAVVGEAVEVTISAEPVSPAVTGDYSLSTNKTLTIAANQLASTGTVTITGVDNDVDAADKTVTVKGEANVPDSQTLADSLAETADISLTLTDDDTRGVTLSESVLEIDEGDDDGAYTVVLDTQPTASVTVRPYRDSGDIEITVSGPLTFTTSNWDTAQTVTVSAGQDEDAVDDTAEIKHLVGGGDYDDDSLTAGSVVVNAADDETVATGVALTVSPAAVAESANATTITVTATLNGDARTDTTPVTVNVESGTATSGTDFAAVSNFTITIPVGAMSQTGTFSLDPTQDLVDEADETVKVSGATTVTDFTVTGATVEITDDDTRGVTLSATSLEIDEGGSGTYTVVLDTRPTAAVTVTPSRGSGDTDVTVSGPLTFGTGDWKTAQTVTVSAAGDGDANDDSAEISHAVAGGDYDAFAAGSVSIDVDDDEEASEGVSLSVSPSEVAESANATEITVTAALDGGTRDAATPVVVSVDSETAISGTDFAAVSNFTITIPANALSQTGTFSLDPTQDTVDEPDETVAVTGTTTVTDFSVTGATVEITDDDASPTVTLSLSRASIDETDDSSTADVAENRTTVTASLNRTSSAETTVTISADPNSPATASDYAVSTNKVLTIAAGATTSTGTVTITAVDNDVDAADKTVKVKGDATNTVGISDPADATLTIDDDDTRGVTLSKTDLDIDEGDSGTYTVQLDTKPTAAVTVTPSRGSGDTDVTVSSALTFTTSNWGTAQTVTVSAAQDSDAADDSAVIAHSVGGGDYASFAAGSVSVSVDDDETASSSVTLTVSPDEVAESANATNIVVTATLNGGTRGATTPVVVSAGSGTATSGTDFAAVSNFTITIPANAQSHTGTFSLDPTQDTVDEPDETVAVTGTTTVSNFSVTGTTVEIADDDASPTVTLSLSRTSIFETDDSSTTDVTENRTTVTARLDHASVADTTVTISVDPDSPATAADYAVSTNKELTIAAGSTTSTGTVTITAVDNSIDAPSKSVKVKGDATNTVGISDPADATLTIADDDTRGVTLSKTDLDIDEGDSGTYTVKLDTKPTAAVTVTPSRGSGDTDVTVSSALTFTTSNWGTAQTVTVSAAQDSDAADDSAVIAHAVGGGDYASFTAGSVSVSVDDDETASSGVTLTVSPDEVAESANATNIVVTATLNGGTRGATTPVVVSAGSGTATSGTDFAAVSNFTITIPANAQSQTGTFSLDPTQDTVDEPDETVAVTGTTTVSNFSVTGTTVEIADDDASPTVTLSLSRTSIFETDDSSTTDVTENRTTVTARLDHASVADTTVTISVDPDSPATAADYAVSTNKELTIAAGQTASTGTVTITAVDNSIDAPSKSVKVKGDASNTRGVTDPADAVLTIRDDDTRGVTLSQSSLDIDEGDSGTYTVKLDTRPTAAVTVRPLRSRGPTSVTFSGPLTFTTSNWATAQSVTISAAEDTDADDETAVIAHAVTGGDYDSFAARPVSVSVDDDETASSGVTLTTVQKRLSENAVATDVTVTATLNGGTRDGTTPVVVSVGSGTAISGTDFAAVSNFTITIPANALSQTGTFSLDPTQDTVDEPDETVAVTGTTTVSNFSVTGATVTITDDDAAPTVTLTLTPASIAESDDTGTSDVAEHRTTVTASLNHTSSAETKVTISVAPNSPAVAADYAVSTNKVLTIAAGATASTGTVTITAVDNDIDAADKTAKVKGDATNTVGISDPADATLTIDDDDTRGVTLSKTDLDIDEGDSGTYTVQLDTKPTAAVTVTPSRGSGDTDVTVSSALTFTTSNWGTAQTVTVSAAQDSDAADDSAVIAHSVGGGDYASFAAGSVSVSVDDDETASSSVTLTVSPDEVAESANATNIVVTATLNGGTRGATTPVVVSAGSGTATSGTDFAAVSNFTITIPANAQSHTGTFSLDPTQDTVDEPDETVAVTGTTTVSNFSVTGATVTITDDDAAPTVTLSLSRASIDETDDSSTTDVTENRTTVTASLNHTSSAETTVTISVSPDSPAVAADYAVSTNKVLTIAAGQTASTGTVTITAVNNTKDTPDKTVQVKGDATNAVGATDPADVELTLADDDGIQQTQGQNNQASTAATLSVSPAAVGESAQPTVMTVRAALNGRPRSTATPVAVSVVSGTATAGTDFSTVTGFTISIEAGALSQTGTFTFVPTSDTIDEPDETVLMSGSTTVSNFSVSGTDFKITDDDASPTVTLSLSRTSIFETDDSSTTDVTENRTTVTASLDHASVADTTVTISVDPDSPATAADYAVSTNKELTIAAGQTASTGTVTITAVDNSIDAPSKSVKVKGDASNTQGVTDPADAVLTIRDDDTRGVTLSKTDLDIDEGDSGTYTVKLDTRPTAAVTVRPLRSSGDTSVTFSGPLTFTTSNWGTAQTVTISAAEDSDADDETAVIGNAVSGGDYESFAAASVSVSVDDDETASSGVTLTTVQKRLSENAVATDVTVTATLNGGTRDGTTPVVVSVGSGTAISGTDFAAVSNFTITIPANTQSQTGTFSLDPTQDTVDEPDETVSVTGTTTVSNFSVTGATVTITDDDAAPTVTLTLTPASIAESDDTGTSDVAEHRTTVTASLNHTSSAETTVTISVAPDSPATASDFAVSTNKELTIAAGATASTGTVTITAVDNDIDAADKTAKVKGDATNTVGISDPADATLTIDDDDTRGVTLSKTDLDIDEGDSGTYTVKLDTKPTAAVTVTPSRGSGDTDVTVSSALTFTTSNWGTAQTVTVSAAQDSDAVDDSAIVAHAVAGGDYASFAAGSVSVSVDDDETASSGVTLTVAPGAVAESANATNIVVTATLNGGTRDATTPVVVSAGSGTATSGTDFAAVNNFTITIPANTQSHTGTFSLDPTQDTVDEPDETVAVTGTTTVSNFSVTGATVEITDDDASPTVTLTLTPASIAESDDTGTSNVAEHRTTVTASLNHTSSAETKVTISVAPNSPAVAADYAVSTNKVLTIAAGATASTGTVTITAVDNDIDAANKTVKVKGDATNTVGVTDPADATLTINDDDTRGVTLSKTELDVSEGDSGTYTVKLDTKPTAAVTVTPSRGSGDTDVTVSSALTFTTSNWGTAQTVTVSAAQDSDAADDSAVIAHSVGGGDYASFTAGSVSVSVDDDETASSGVTLTVSPDAVAESANATNIVVTATLNGGTRGATTPVVVSAGSGTATSGTDFAAVSNFTITIPANAQSQTGTFSLDPTQDTVDEPDETVSVTGTTTVSNFSVTGATVEITDDDASPTVTLSLSRASIDETDDSSTTDVTENRTTVTASLNHTSSAETTVTISVSPDSPAVAADYAVSTNKVLTIAAGSTASTGTVTITAVDNTKDTPDKTVQVKGDASNTVGATDPADVELTLVDDDGIKQTQGQNNQASTGVTLSVSPAAVSESASPTTVTVTAALNGRPRSTATPVAVSVGSGTATASTDFSTVTGFTISIGSGALSQTGTFTFVPTSDTVDEPDETVKVSGTTTVTGITVTGTDFKITDDDAAPTVTLALTPASIAESDDTGTSNVAENRSTVTASLNHASSAETTVTVSVAPDSPAVAADYAVSTNKVLTIAAGAKASTGVVTITAVDNEIDAADKTVKVKGDASNAVGITDPADATLTLADDDTRGVKLSKTDLDIDEGDSGTYTVALTSRPTAAVTVTPSRGSGDTDVTVSSALTFTTSDWGTAQTVTVSAAQDSDPDDDSAVIAHAVTGGDYASFAAGSVSVSVDDDETASSVVTLTVAPETVAESANATNVVVTATLNGGTRDSTTPVAVIVGSGTATSGTDFAAVAGFTITIPANAQSQTGTFSLDPTQDTIDESDETVAVDGSTSVAGVSVTDATVEITDDDAAPTVTLTLTPASIREADDTDTSNVTENRTTVTASLNHASSAETTVTVSVAPNSPAIASDYAVSTNKVLTIAAGQTASTGTVTITAVDNDIDAADKTVKVKGDASNTVGISDPADATLTIADDDTRGVTLSKTDLDIDEGDSGTYTVQLDTKPTAAVTVTPSRGSGDTDVTVSSALTFTTSDWGTAQTVTVSAAQDSDAAADSAVIAHAVAGGDYASFTAGSVSVSVDDDETASSGVTLTVSPDEVAESANATNIVVTATLNGGTREATTPVVVSAGSGTATSGTDFAAVSNFTITIPANALSQTGTFSLDPTQDTVDEPDESVAVTGTTTVGNFSVTGATVEITDDDAAPTVTLSLSRTSIDETDDSGTTNVTENRTAVTATLNHTSSVETRITISVDPDSPATASDYTTGTNQVLTVAAGATASTGTVTITAVDNDIDAADKTVKVKGDASNTVGITDPADATLTLADDDTRGVVLSATDLEVNEGDSGTYTVALTSQPTAAVTVTPSRSSGDTDVTVSGALTFAASDWGAAQTVTVSAAQDSDAADDSAVIAHSVGGGDYASFAAGSVSVSVDDDETASSGVTLTVSPDTVAESANATDIVVTATLNGGARDATTPVVVSAGSGTATSGADFAAVSNFTITIPANAQSHTGTFSLDPTQDTVDEPDETVSVTGATTVGNFAVTDAAVTITDDDNAPDLILILTPDTIDENGGESAVTASLSHPSSAATTVTVSVTPNSPADTDDYVLSENRELTIAAGDTASTGAVTITAVDNGDVEADKTFQVAGDAANPQGIGASSSPALTIENDDEARQTDNNAPAGSDKTIEIDEDQTYGFQADDFGFTDADAEDSLDSVKIVNLPAKGSLEVNGTSATADQSVSRADIDAGNFAFVPDANEHGSPYAGFDFKVGDGKDESETANAMTLNVRSVNDPATGKPVISGAAVNGEVLLAQTSEIRDIDGLSRASFGYQWIRVAGGAEAEISGASGSTYALVDADVGAALKVRVRFVDDDGFAEEAISDPTGGVAPAPPSEPTNFRVTNGNRQAILTWEPPVDDGGGEIIDYEIRHSHEDPMPDSVNWVSAGMDLTETVPGISTEEDYNFEVRAVNDAGAGPPALEFMSAEEVTSPPDAPPDTPPDTPPDAQIVAPDAPGDLTVAAGDGLAALTWREPASDGGAEVSHYEIRFAQGSGIPDETAWRSAGADLREVVTGLVNGLHYEFEVRAVNSAGAGPAAAASADLPIPATPPEAPRNLSATPGDGQAVLNWEPPAGDGGAEVSEYQYRYAQGDSVPDDSAWRSAGTALTVSVGGIANGRTYAFEVRAVNEIGAGPAAMASADLPTPATVPEAPLRLTAAAGERQVTLTWEPPANDGGAAISDYEYRFAEGLGPPSGAVWRSAGTDLTESVTGLGEGQRYAFEVRAVNGVGAGPAASASAETPRPRRIDVPVVESWLARFGRTASADTAEAIRQRLEEGPQRNQLIFNGRRVDGLFARREENEAEPLALMSALEIGETAMDRLRYGAGSAPFVSPGGSEGASRSMDGTSAGPGIASAYDVGFEIGMENGRVSRAGIGGNRGLPKLSDMLLRSSFHYALAQDAESSGTEGLVTHTLWGGANRSRFDANIDSLALNGDVTTGTMAYDYQSGRLVTGVALSYSDGEGRFRDASAGSGVIVSSLSGVYPYAYLQAGRRASFWGVAGYGNGELQLMPDDASSFADAAGLSNAMAAFGGRGVLSIREGGSGSFELAVRGDALLTNTSADGDGGKAFADASASTRRLRLLLEATGSIESAGGVLSPTLEAGFRHDAGDAEQGTGFELGGGLSWNTGPLTLQLNGRGLLAHDDEAYREWGYSASVQYRPGESERGLLIDLTSSRGAGYGGAERLWAMPDTGGLVQEHAISPGQSIRFEMGYGLESAWREALWSPYLGVETFSGEGRALRMGLRIRAGDRIDAGLEFGRRISGFELPLDTVQLRGTIRW